MSEERNRDSEKRIGLGWRVHSWWAVVVAVSGPAASPDVIHREHVRLIDDESAREPYHAAASLVGGRVGLDAGPFLSEARVLIESIEKAAAAAAAAMLGGFASSLGPIAAVGVVGGDHRVPTEWPPILASHARLHASERDLYERAIIKGATDAGLSVTTIPATGRLIYHASQVLGVALAPSLAALGQSIESPWQKDHKEATAAALVTLNAVA